MKRILILFLFFTLFACSKDSMPNPELDWKQYEIYCGKKVPIRGENLQEIIWVSDNKFVATASNGYISPHHVGESYISSPEYGLGFKVTVKPKQQLFKDKFNKYYLDVEWGTTEEQLDKKFNLSFWDNKYLGVQTGDSVVPCILYNFSNNKLSSYTMCVRIEYGEELIEYLTERYEVLTQVTKYDFAFTHKNKQDTPDLLAYVSIGSPYIFVIVMPL